MIFCGNEKCKNNDNVKGVCIKNDITLEPIGEDTICLCDSVRNDVYKDTVANKPKIQSYFSN